MPTPEWLRAATMVVTLSAASGPALAQTNPPILDTTVLLNSRYFEGGNVMIEFVDWVFAPASPATTRLKLLKAGGEEIASLEFFPDYHSQQTVFARANAQGAGQLQLPGPGAYVLEAHVDGAVATRFAFTAQQVGGNDPFDPAQQYHYSGPWSELAYVQPRAVGEARHLDVVFWVGRADLAPGSRADQAVVTLLKGGTVIAHSNRSGGAIADAHYQQAVMSLFHPHEARQAHAAPPLKSGELADGAYELRITRQSDQGLLRRFDLTVADGAIQPTPRGTLGHPPRAERLSPRVYQKGGSHYQFHEAIWLSTDR